MGWNFFWNFFLKFWKFVWRFENTAWKGMCEKIFLFRWKNQNFPPNKGSRILGAKGRFWPILATRGLYRDQIVQSKCIYSLIYILVPVETSSGQDGQKTTFLWLQKIPEVMTLPGICFALCQFTCVFPPFWLSFNNFRKGPPKFVISGKKSRDSGAGELITFHYVMAWLMDVWCHRNQGALENLSLPESHPALSDHPPLNSKILTHKIPFFHIPVAQPSSVRHHDDFH